MKILDDVRHSCLLNLHYLQHFRMEKIPMFVFIIFAQPEVFVVLTAAQPLPPTYEEHLSGLPGFTANIDYAVHLVINNKHNLKSALFGNTKTYVTLIALLHDGGSKHLFIAACQRPLYTTRAPAPQSLYLLLCVSRLSSVLMSHPNGKFSKIGLYPCVVAKT